MIAMTVTFNDALTGCRELSSLNNGQAIPTPFDPLRYSINPSCPAAVGGVDLTRPVDQPPHAIEAFRTDEMDCQLLRFPKASAAEMEFSLETHLIILLPEGMSGGCEWRNGEHARSSSSMPPNTIIFKPAHNYLWLRKRISRTSCRMLLLTFSPNVVNRLSDSNIDTVSVRFVQRVGMDDEAVRRTLLDFLQEIESPGWNSKFHVETLLTLLLSQLIRCASNLSEPRRVLYRKGGLTSWRLKQSLELLESTLSDAPSLTELARRVQLHPISFCRAFKQSTGLTPHQYLLTHRINCAREMMKDQTRTLTEIAFECGFSSSSQFSVVFRRIVGTSPREYRRSL
jgi:AraC-like DNA-binding protein